MVGNKPNLKINVTKNYRLFSRSDDNRPLDMKKHKKLFQSMKRYGFLNDFPIACRRDDNKHLVVKDGQHRLAIAETLGLPVYWVEGAVDFDVAVVNGTAKIWHLRDYATKFATNGNQDYQKGLAFAEAHKLPLGTAFSLLAGTTSWTNVQSAFFDGDFKIKDQQWANAVAGIYGPMTEMSAVLRNARFVEACMAVCRIKEFDATRLLQNAHRCREKLVAYSTKDAYLDMLEDIYNFGRKHLLGLKAAAIMAMRERSAVKTNGKK
jgi:hypothetical protein